MIFSLLSQGLLRVTEALFASAVGARIYRHFPGSATHIGANFDSFFPHIQFTNVFTRFHGKDYLRDMRRKLADDLLLGSQTSAPGGRFTSRTSVYPPKNFSWLTAALATSR